MNFAAFVGLSLRSGYALLRDDPTTACYANNRQGIHLTEAKRCSDQADHLSLLSHGFHSSNKLVLAGDDLPDGFFTRVHPHKLDHCKIAA